MKANITFTLNNKKIFLLILMLCSSFCYLGEFGKEIDSKYGMFIIPVVVFLSYVFLNSIPNTITRDLKWVLLLVSMIIFCYILVGGGLGSVINNIAAVLFIWLFRNVKLQREDLRFLSKVFLILQFYMAFLCLRYRHSEGYIGIFNTNTIGMQIVLNLLFIDMYMTYKHKWMSIAVNLASLALIIYTRSRSSLIVGAVVILVLLINRFHMFKPRTMSFGYWLMSIIGVGFPFFLVELWRGNRSETVSKVMDFSVNFFQKSLFTGREAVWAPAVEKLTESTKSFLWGIGTHYSDEHFFGGNFHNSYFTIMICCGIITYVLFMLYLFHFFKEGKYATKDIQRSRLLYLAIMIVGITESTLFSGHFAIIAYLLLSMSNSDQGDFCLC